MNNITNKNINFQSVNDRGYEPVIREGGNDIITNDRLKEDSDSYPYITSSDKQTSDFSEEIVCIENFYNEDSELTNLLFQGLEYYDTISTIRNIKKQILKSKYLTKKQQLQLKSLGITLVSAIEAEDNLDAAIRNVFNKLTEYIRKISEAFGKWLGSTADLQQRSIASIVALEKQYYRLFKVKEKAVSVLRLDIEDNGCPTAKALETILSRSQHLLSVLNVETNPTNIVLLKLIQKAKILYADGDISALDNFLKKNEEGELDKDIINEFLKIQAKFTGVGITFSEAMAAAFEDVLEYRDDTLVKLGYEEDTFKTILKVLPTKDQIEKLKYICEILNRISTYFSSVKIENADSADSDTLDMYINTIPKILTIVISVYRTAIVAAREYTTTALAIEQAIVEQFQ